MTDAVWSERCNPRTWSRPGDWFTVPQDFVPMSAARLAEVQLPRDLYDRARMMRRMIDMSGAFKPIGNA